MRELGIFNDEGCIERGFYTPEAAEAIRGTYEEADELRVRELCHDHEEQPADACESCAL